MKILKSLAIIFSMVIMAAGATSAYFTDQVVMINNNLNTGSIRINVDGEREWNGKFIFNDVKPGYVKHSDFTVNNVGDNPANITKSVDVMSDNGHLASVLDYSLSVAIYPPESNTPYWHQTLYDDNVVLQSVNGQGTFLGMLPAGWSMRVNEDYRMQVNAGNAYQNQSMTFNIVIDAEQLTGTLLLSDKSGDPDWKVLKNHTGTLTYGVSNSLFNYNFASTTLTPGTAYTLVIGDDYPFDAAHHGVALGQGTANGAGDLNLSGAVDVGSRTNQKVWLILTSDWNGSSMTGWNPSSYLFETGLIDYYKS